MKSQVINRNSTYQDIQQLLTGSWSESTQKGFTVLRTPFFTVITGTLEKGSHILPVVPNATAMLKWANAVHSGIIAVKARQEVVELPENAVVELIYWGQSS